jgi:hypothetical protein
VAVATDAASEAATATDITICFIFTPQKIDIQVHKYTLSVLVKVYFF